MRAATSKPSKMVIQWRTTTNFEAEPPSSFACFLDKPTLRTAGVVEQARPLSLVVTVFAATWLACQLRNVHDSTNLRRDIGLVGRALAAILCEGGCFFVPRVVRELLIECIFGRWHLVFRPLSPIPSP